MPAASVEEDDTALLARCLTGDQAACEVLVHTYARMVGTVIWRATGAEEDVEDLTQEAFLRAFRALSTFRGQSKVSTWLCTIAHRVAIDHLRRRASTRPVVGDRHISAEGDGVLDRLEDPSPDPEAVLEASQMHRLVREQLALLPEKYRVPLEYAAVQGLDYQTIAAMLDVPLGTVKTFVFRGRQQLRERVARVLRQPGGTVR